MDRMPSGRGFDAFGAALHGREDDPVAAAGVADYLSRIYTGYSSVVEPGFHATGCEFVMRDWRERGDREGTPTKTAAQLVSATAIYRLGFELMQDARRRRTRGMRAALDFRNGILLAIAVALPQRARALSVLELARTLTIRDEASIHICIPGRFIKQREHLKSGAPYDKVIRNKALVAAITEYFRDFRPIFDAGRLLFPSFHAPMQGISETQVGQLAGDVTLRELGVRVPIHRFRDNVATEISETITDGGRLASAVLGHRDVSTTERHYDHSQSFQVANEYSDFVDLRRSAPTDLLV
jgi:integrase